MPNLIDCYDCEGSGKFCDACDLSEESCDCDEPKLEECDGCDGTGSVCEECGAPEDDCDCEEEDDDDD